VIGLKSEFGVLKERPNYIENSRLGT